MFKLLHNTFVEDAACMTTVTDDEIKKNGGEAKHLFIPPEDGNPDDVDFKDTVVDPEIFGTFEEASKKKMGYYVLSAPVINVNWITGTYPLLGAMLHMDTMTLRNIVYFGYSVVTEDSEDGDYKVGYVFKSEKEKRQAASEGIVIKSGPEAVIALMNYYNIENTGIVHNVVPILPLGVRYLKRDDGSYSRFGIVSLLDNVIIASERHQKLTDMINKGSTIPSIILENDYRLLQEAVDKYINNGANQKGICMQFGAPIESLHEFYKFISVYAINKTDFTPNLYGVKDDVIANLKKCCEMIQEKEKISENEESFEESNGAYVAEESEEEKEIDKQYNKAFDKAKSLMKEPVKDYFDEVYKYYGDFYKNMYEVFCDSIENSLYSPNVLAATKDIQKFEYSFDTAVRNAKRCVDFYIEKYTPFQYETII